MKKPNATSYVSAKSYLSLYKSNNQLDKPIKSKNKCRPENKTQSLMTAKIYNQTYTNFNSKSKKI